MCGVLGLGSILQIYHLCIFYNRWCYFCIFLIGDSVRGMHNKSLHTCKRKMCPSLFLCFTSNVCHQIEKYYFSLLCWGILRSFWLGNLMVAHYDTFGTRILRCGWHGQYQYLCTLILYQWYLVVVAVRVVVDCWCHQCINLKDNY